MCLICGENQSPAFFFQMKKGKAYSFFGLQILVFCLPACRPYFITETFRMFRLITELFLFFSLFLLLL